MATLVFDIETSALPPEIFDQVQNEYLFRECERIEDAAEREKRRGEIAQMMSLWPFTSRVVCIAMVNADSARVDLMAAGLLSIARKDRVVCPDRDR